MTGKAAAVPMALSCGPSITDFEVVLDRNYPRPFVAKLPLPMHVPYHPWQDKNQFRAAHYIPANEQLHCSGECEASVDVIARGVDPSDGPPRLQVILSRTPLFSLLQRIRPRALVPGQDGDPRVPVLIKLSASSAIFLIRVPARRSTVRPSRFHHSQTSSAHQRINRAVRPIPMPTWAPPWRQNVVRVGEPPTRCAPACWRAPRPRHSDEHGRVAPWSIAPEACSAPRHEATPPALHGSTAFAGTCCRAC